MADFNMTREEAIKALERAEYYAGIHYVNGVEDPYISPYLLKAIDFAVAALREQEERRWIPVTERMPENIGLYLVIEKHWLDGSPGIKIAKWNTVDWFTADRRSKEITPRVTHWMPLPQPQKGE